MLFTNFFYFLQNRVAGTAGAVVTCPLEVVKTRLQSSNPVFGNPGHGVVTYGNNVRNGNSSRLPSHHTTSTHNQRHQHHTLSGAQRGHLNSSRLISTCINCGRNSHILAVARSIPPNPMPSSTLPKLGLVQCLR